MTLARTREDHRASVSGNWIGYQARVVAAAWEMVVGTKWITVLRSELRRGSRLEIEHPFLIGDYQTGELMAERKSLVQAAQHLISQKSMVSAEMNSAKHLQCRR